MANTAGSGNSKAVCGGSSSLGLGGKQPSCWGGQMEALVSDLSLALDESQRRRKPHRRRTNHLPGNT